MTARTSSTDPEDVWLPWWPTLEQRDRLVDEGRLPDQAEAARRLGCTRARLTQLLDLTKLSPDLQERLLFLEAVNGAEPMTEVRPTDACMCRTAGRLPEGRNSPMSKTSTDIPVTPSHAEALNAAFQTSVTAFAEAMRVGTAFEVMLAFRATIATAMAMFRARPDPADQAAADAMEHELAGVDRDIASRAARLPN